MEGFRKMKQCPKCKKEIKYIGFWKWTPNGNITYDVYYCQCEDLEK